MKTILLCTDGSPFAETSYSYGAWFAARLPAHIKVLFVTDIRSQQIISTSNLSGAIGIDASDQLLNQLVDLEHERARLNHQRARMALKTAADRFQSLGIDAVDYIHETGFLVDCFHDFEETADLIILGKRGETAEFASGHLGANVERILRATRKPCLVTPKTVQPIDHLLIAYDGSQSGRRILDFLGNSTVFQGLNLSLVMVAKPGEREAAIAQLREADGMLQGAGFTPTCAVLEGNPETAIAQYAEEQAVNLLLMGAYGHSRIRHLVIGSTTTQILRSTSIPVLVFR
jgi:nucleotide-binding universal stress UspA family protein